MFIFYETILVKFVEEIFCSIENDVVVLLSRTVSNINFIVELVNDTILFLLDYFKNFPSFKFYF